jgi:exodeoxyribonuclease VII large subunit
MRYYLSQQSKLSTSLTHRLERQHPSHQLQRQSQQLDELQLRLQRSMDHFIASRLQKVERQQYKLQLHSPVKRLNQQKSSLQYLEQKLLDAMDRKLLNTRHQLALAAEKLDTVSPLATLKRGYSITQNESGKVITKASDTKTGDTLVTRLSEGEIRSTVV